MPDVFFLVEEQSDGAREAGQVSQPVRACEPELGDLSKPAAPAYFIWRQVNVCRCHEFWSNSINKVRRFDKFSVMF